MKPKCLLAVEYGRTTFTIYSIEKFIGADYEDVLDTIKNRDTSVSQYRKVAIFPVNPDLHVELRLREYIENNIGRRSKEHIFDIIQVFQYKQLEAA